MRAVGDLAANKWPSYNKAGSVKCVNGLATVVKGDPTQTFRCDNVSERPRLLAVHAKDALLMLMGP